MAASLGRPPRPGSALADRSGHRPLGLERHEVDLLAHAAVRAAPVGRDVGPGGAGREALVLVAGLDLVGVAAAGQRAASTSAAALVEDARLGAGRRDPCDRRARAVPREERVALARADVGPASRRRRSGRRTRGSITRRQTAGTIASTIIPAYPVGSTGDSSKSRSAW